MCDVPKHPSLKIIWPMGGGGIAHCPSPLATPLT